MDYTLRSFPEVAINPALFSGITESILGRLRDAGHAEPAMDAFQDKQLARDVTSLAQSMASEQVESATKYLEDPEVGAVCVVTPEDPDGSSQVALIRAVLLMAFTATPDNPLASDRLNRTPFALYGASDDNKKAMTDAGLRQFAPDAVLGFHNDGALGVDDTYIPERVGLQNVVLRYGRPGKFHWLPFSLWEEGEKLLEEHGDQVLRISTTPIAHREGGTGDVVVDREVAVTAPAIWRSSDGLPTVFLNGDPMPESEGLFRAIQRSLARSATRLVSEQALHRLTVIRNDRGVHARDVLQDPQASGTTHSRMLCRTISSRGVVVPTTTA